MGEKKLMKKRFIAITAALIIALGLPSLTLVSCGAKNNETQTGNSVNPANSAEATGGEAGTGGLGRQLNIGIVGAACELHFYAAEKLGLYEAAGYDINWIHVGTEQTAMIAAGTIDMTDGVLDHWLKPIENGLDIKATIGLQQGCMGTVVLADSPYYALEDLKGQTLATLNASGVGNYLWRLLLLEGYKPQEDFNWIQIQGDAAIAALETGEVEAVSGGDVGLWAKVKTGEARFLSMMSTDPQLADQTCCLLVFNRKFTEDYPDDVKKLTEVLYEASLYLQTEEHIKEITDYGYEMGLIASGNPEDAFEVGKTYTWKPGTQIGIDTFSSIFQAYQEFDIITKDADLQKVLDKLFIKYEEFM
jgi:NitT/TauT family transport system substrate-binding protein